MGHPTQRGVCPDMACQLIRKMIEEGSVTDHGACNKVAEQLGVPLQTVRSWLRRDMLGSTPTRVVEKEVGAVAPTSPASRLGPDPEQDVEEAVREMRPEKPKPKTYRPDPNEETMVVSYEFNAAFEAMLAAIQNARADGWKATPRRAALRHIAALYSIAEGGD